VGVTLNFFFNLFQKLMKCLFLTIIVLECLLAQKMPYGEPKFFEMHANIDIPEQKLSVPSTIEQSIFEKIEPIPYQERDYYFLKIHLNNNDPVHFRLIKNNIINDMDIFFINLDTRGWLGPYSTKVIKNNSNPISGG